MARKTQSNEKAPKKCRDCENWRAVQEKVRVHELLERTITQFENKIRKEEYEPTLAEYVKLLQLEREMGQDDEAKEIRVTWVDPKTASDCER